MSLRSKGRRSVLRSESIRLFVGDECVSLSVYKAKVPKVHVDELCTECVVGSSFCEFRRSTLTLGSLVSDALSSIHRAVSCVRAQLVCALHGHGEAPWLILPVVICLSQRLSHACLSACRIKVKPRMAH